MGSRRAGWVFAFAFVACGGQVAPSSSFTRGPRPTLDDIARLAAAVCDHTARCDAEAFSHRWRDRAHCIASTSVELRVFLYDDPKVVFPLGYVSACTAKLGSACWARDKWLFDVEGCFVTGSGNVGDACSSSLSCAVDADCVDVRAGGCGHCVEAWARCPSACSDGEECAGGVCAPTLPAGASCATSNRRCEAGTTCGLGTDTCVPLLKLGDDCGDTKPPKPTTMCAGDLDCVGAICRSREYVASGATCGSVDGKLLSCDHGEHCSGYIGVCGMPVKEGDACVTALGTPLECEDYATCELGVCRRWDVAACK